MRAVHLAIGRGEERNFRAQLLEIEQVRFETVVEIGGVVGDLVHEIDQLRFERRALVEQILGELRKFRRGVIARMFDDAFAHFEGEIQAGKIEIALLELLDDAQRVQIVIEALAVLAHALVELLFAGVAEGRMADVVDQRQRLGKIRIQTQRAGNGASDLRDFQSVRQAIAKMIGKAGGENLRLRFQPAESARMDDAVAVARVVVAVGMRGSG